MQLGMLTGCLPQWTLDRIASRELRDGGLAPGRVPRQPGVLTGDIAHRTLRPLIVG
ncbi:hypothetical protein [Saccharopolyspora spinosa]|uniref:hypothetical protein n=1 Tax=Saccharopolyspora spinosa TaxID=60894 RepID=UPI00031824AF|nr:hypothetical protein [Saccharopolyspora spinosa]